MSENKSVIRAGQVLECLFEDGFQGKTTARISLQIEMPSGTVWRILQSWKALGWVIEIPVAGNKSTCWKVSDRLAGIAFQFKRQMIGDIQALEKHYLDVVGETLN